MFISYLKVLYAILLGKPIAFAYYSYISITAYGCKKFIAIKNAYQESELS